MLRLLNFSFNGDIHWGFFYCKHQSRKFIAFVWSRPRLRRKNYDLSVEVIKNCDKYIFVGRCLLILLTRQFLI